MTDRTRLSLTAEGREALSHCVKTVIGLVQIAVATGAHVRIEELEAEVAALKAQLAEVEIDG